MAPTPDTQIWLMNAKEGHLSRQGEAGKNAGPYDAGSLLCKATSTTATPTFAIGPVSSESQEKINLWAKTSTGLCGYPMGKQLMP